MERKMGKKNADEKKCQRGQFMCVKADISNKNWGD